METQSEPLTPDTSPPPAPGTPAGVAPPPCTPSSTFALTLLLPQSPPPRGAPPPQPAHTYGKLSKVAAPPLPLRPRGTSIRLSGSNGGAPRRRKFSPASAMTFDPEKRVALGPFERPHVVFKAPSPTENPSHLPARPSPGTSACSRCRTEPCSGTRFEAQARLWSQAGALRPGRHIPPRP